MSKYKQYTRGGGHLHFCSDRIPSTVGIRRGRKAERIEPTLL
jgi:hypothetical protein